MGHVNAVKSPDVVTLGNNLLDKLKIVGNAIDGIRWERENFLQLGDYLKRLDPIICEVNEAPESTPELVDCLESLLKDAEAANQLTLICTTKSRIYLLTHCRSVVKQLENVTHSIGRHVGSIPLSAVEGNVDVQTSIDDLSQAMQKAGYQVQETEERIFRTLEQDQDSIRRDIAVQSGIVMDIARTLGVEDLPHNPGALKDQIEILRNDMQDNKDREGGYDLKMVDVLGNIFDNWAQVHDHPSPSSETQQRLHSRIEPLYDAFVCPLTKQVMLDPVTLENGQTYERSAIERWFQQCVDDKREISCPMTGQLLTTKQLKPSIALRNTIEEWTARNEAARIENASGLINSENCASEDLLYALKDLQALVLRNRLNKYRIRTAGLIPRIVTLLKNQERVRVRALVLLRSLAEDDVDNKDAIAEAGALKSTLKCLTRSVSDERQEAAGLLYELSMSEDICEQMGATNGMILYLVGITSSKSDNIVAVQKAEATLENLERLDINVRQLAENGRVQPLIRRLVRGSDETKLEMATDLATVPLTTEGKILVTEQGAGTLVSMLDDKKFATREASLRAIRTLSTLDSNGKVLVEAGVLRPLIRDLFMVGAAYVKLKEVCATVLANVVSSSGDWQNIPIDSEGNTLISEPIVHNLLHLISNTGPIIEAKLLLVLVGLASSPLAVANLVSYIRSSGAMISLIQFLEAPQDQLRVPAIRLLFLLSTHMGQELADGLRITTRQLGTLVRLLATNDGLIEEQAAAAGLMANLPVEDFALTKSLLDEHALPILITRIDEIRRRNAKIGEAKFMAMLHEGLVTILARFTYVLSDRTVAQLAREHDLMAYFTNLLQNATLDEVQCQSAKALENLSLRTPLDVIEVHTPDEKDSLCWYLSCFRPPPPPPGVCPVHGGICSARDTFCLVEAHALDPLVACLDHHNYAVVEAAVGALGTLVMDNVDFGRGVQCLHAANAIQPILNIMQEHRTQLLRQRSILMVERILRNTDLAKLISLDQNVTTGLVDALRNGNSATKSTAEKCLKHMDKLPKDSAIFSTIGPGNRGRPPGY